MGFPAIRHWVFDLDNTLYSPHSSIFPQIHVRMEEYIMRHFGISAEAASKKRTDYFHTYGTSLLGLMKEEHIEPQHFLDYVHDVDFGELQPDAEISRLLAALPGRKLIFTNADRRHATRVLGKLGLADQFDDMFGIEDGDYICKPNTEAYQAMLKAFAIAPQDSAMVEDMEVNLKPAHALGMTTFWLRHSADWLRNPPGPSADYPHCHHAADDLRNMLLTMNGTSR